MARPAGEQGPGRRFVPQDRRHGQVRGHTCHPHGRARCEVGGRPREPFSMSKNRIGAAEQGAGEDDVAGPALVRKHVVADHDHVRAWRGRAAQAPHDGDVRGHLDRREEGEHSEVTAAAQPPPGPQPAIRPAPGQQPPGQRIRLALRLLNRLHARVKRRRVHRPPRLDHHVVPGGRQPVREFGRMPRAAALVRVRRPDQRNPHGCPIGHGPASTTSFFSLPSLTSLGRLWHTTALMSVAARADDEVCKQGE